MSWATPGIEGGLLPSRVPKQLCRVVPHRCHPIWGPLSLPAGGRRLPRRGQEGADVEEEDGEDVLAAQRPRDGDPVPAEGTLSLPTAAGEHPAGGGRAAEGGKLQLWVKPLPKTFKMGKTPLDGRRGNQPRRRRRGCTPAPGEGILIFVCI